jgi:hypothetical protein
MKASSPSPEGRGRVVASLLQALLVPGLLASCARVGADAPGGPDLPAPVQHSPVDVPPGEWLRLFDGKTLGKWKVMTEDAFEDAGDVRVEDGEIVLGKGDPFTGVRWTGEFPKEGFEVRVSAKRRSDEDIFCGLTVPVGDAHVTLVLGGWGNSIAGLSNVDHRNASDNQTTHGMSFNNDRWYDVRLRVTQRRVVAWVDGEEIVSQKRKDRTFTVYFELEPIRPVGFFSWQTTAALADIQMKRLWPEETKDEAAADEYDWW